MEEAHDPVPRKEFMKWPLMYNNITDGDADALIQFLSQRPLPILTNSKKVREFEKAWSDWLGVKYSVFVNSGSSANILTLALLKAVLKEDRHEVIVSPLNWVSDISSILHAGMTPIFCDINLRTLAMDEEELLKLITPQTGAVLLTHILGYNGMTQKIIDICKEKDIVLIEDVCESHGATFNGKKCGSIGDISNFSFYYAHHMTSIEGGMVCTDLEDVYERARILRSHGMLRESDSVTLKNTTKDKLPELNPDFIFMQDAYNFRSTELNAVLALNQLPRLDKNNDIRAKNLEIFLKNLDPEKYYTDFEITGNSNYAFTLLMKPGTENLPRRNNIEAYMRQDGVEFRRGMSGGGNQLRQPYLTRRFGTEFAKMFPNTDFVHHFGWYIGNYPELDTQNIIWLTDLLNGI
jgi:CDP-6-deoxy-D-xylo-4-hexulose-3-dehydrase